MSPINNLIDEFIAYFKRKDENAVLELINDIFQCNFKKDPLSQAYAYELQQSSNLALANIHFFEFCTKHGLHPSVCLQSKIMSEVCEIFPKRLIMDQNIDIGDVEKFLASNDLPTDPVFKVIQFRES